MFDYLCSFLSSPLHLHRLQSLITIFIAIRMREEKNVAE
jgi:hypothetical protein